MKKLLCLLLLSFSSAQVFTSESKEENEDNAFYQAHQWIEEMCSDNNIGEQPLGYISDLNLDSDDSDSDDSDSDDDQKNEESPKHNEYAKVNEESSYKDLKIKVDQPAGQEEEDFSVYKFVDKELHDIIEPMFGHTAIKKELLRRGINKERLIKLFVINGLRKKEDLKEIAIGTMEGVGILKFRVQLTNGKEFYLEGADVIHGPIRMFNREKEEEQYWKRIGNSFKEEIVRYYFSHL